MNIAKSRLTTLSYLVAVSILSAIAAPYANAGEAIALPEFGPSQNRILYIAAVFGVISIIAGLMWRAKVMALSPGTQGMQEVGNAIRAGAYAYLRRQMTTMMPLVAVIAIALFFLFKGQPGYTVTLALGVAVAFLLGVAASYGAGYVGMGMAVNGNQRVAHQARTSFKGAHEAAFQSGAVAGMMTVGLGLLGASLIFLVFKNQAMFVLVGFGFGGSLAALFMRVGGGIFTKAADVGADLVGKVEAGIPEDDPRNPATIADNVGDNVGDCAGMAADVFESYAVTLVAAIILGAAVNSQGASDTTVLALALFPLLMQVFGVVASIVGILTVKGQDKADFNPMQPISFGFTIASIAGLILTAGGA